MSNRKIYDAWNEYKNKNVYIKKTKFCREIGCSVDYLNKTIRKFSSESEAPESYKNRDTNKKNKIKNNNFKNNFPSKK